MTMSTNMKFTGLGANQIKTELLDPEFDDDASSPWDFSNTPPDLLLGVKQEFLPERDITNELVSHPPSRPNFSVKRETVSWDCYNGSSIDCRVGGNSFNSESSSSSGKNPSYDESIQGTSFQSQEKSTNIHNTSALHLRDVSVKLIDVLPSNARKLRNVRPGNKSCSSASFEVPCCSSALKFKEVSVKLIDIFPNKISKVGKVQSTCKSWNTPPEQSTLFQRTSALKLRDVFVKLVDIFPSGVRKLGKAHSNSKACTCVICRGDYKCMSTFPNHSDKHVNNSRSTVSQLSTKFQKTPRKSIKPKIQKDQVSFELEEHYQKFTEGAIKRNQLKVKFAGLSQDSPSSPVKFKRNNTKVPFRVNCIERHTNKTVICKVCSMNCKSNADLKRHLVVHTGERPFSCAFCPKRYTQKSAVNFHVRLNHLEKKSSKKTEYSCNYCSAKFLVQKHFVQHTFSVHHDKQPFRCELCPSKFTQLAHLTHHVKKLHPNPFTCNLCSSKFFTLCELEGHLKVVHPTDKPYACNFCHAKFMRKAVLSDHINAVHLKEKAYKCNLCSSKFGWKYNLIRHMKSAHRHTGKKFTGNSCSSKYSGVHELKVHLKEVHPTDKPYACNICHAKFDRKHDLSDHINSVHMKEKAYKCNLCSSKFGWKCTLRKHMKDKHRHMGEKFTGNSCISKYSGLHELKSHLKAAHHIKKP